MCKKISVQKKNPLWGAPNCGGPGVAAPFAPLLIRHWSHGMLYALRLEKKPLRYKDTYVNTLFSVQTAQIELICS